MNPWPSAKNIYFLAKIDVGEGNKLTRLHAGCTNSRTFFISNSIGITDVAVLILTEKIRPTQLLQPKSHCRHSNLNYVFRHVAMKVTGLANLRWLVSFSYRVTVHK